MTNKTMNAVDLVTSMNTELESLRSKDIASESMISLLKSQCAEQAMEISRIAAEHADQIRILQQRHDVAVRRETEIDGILNTVASNILSGLRRMKGDETPERIPNKVLGEVDHPALPLNEMPKPGHDPYAPRMDRKPLEMSDLDAGVRELVRSLPRRVT